MINTTVLVAGFSVEQTERASHKLLVAGACVLTARDEKGSLLHIEGGAVRAMLVESSLPSAEIRPRRRP
jgi:hypothetical protein